MHTYHNLISISENLMIAPHVGMEGGYMKIVIINFGQETLYCGTVGETVNGGISILMRRMINWKRNSMKSSVEIKNQGCSIMSYQLQENWNWQVLEKFLAHDFKLFP